MKTTAIVYSPVRMFAEGVAACLAEQPNIAAVSCCNMDGLRDLVRVASTSVILLDFTEEHALDEGRALVQAFAGVRLVALALPELIDRVIACADAGFAGYVPRGASVDELRRIVQGVLRGEVVCDPKVSRGLLQEVRRRGLVPPDGAVADNSVVALTQRECEVLQHLRHGLSNKEIARSLRLSTATVKNHVHNILSKIKVRSRSEALARLSDEPWLARRA